MVLAGKVWRLLVGVKDALVLALLLLFFGGLYAVLSARPEPTQQREGALYIAMNGRVVEELSAVDPVALLTSGRAPQGEVRERDLLRAIRGAVADSKVKALVLDLSKFEGGGLVHMTEIGAAMDAFRASKKPVMLFGTMLDDDGVQLAAHASEVWVDPLGGAFITGPGGQRLYYGQLLARLNVTAHVFRVGTYKDYVEPYLRNDMSAPSRAARVALYDAVFGRWRAEVAKARPKAQVAKVLADPVGWMQAAGGDAAKASLAAGLVDHIGTRAEFGAAVAKIVGEDKRGGDVAKRPGAFAHASLAGWLAAHPEGQKGKAVGVVTIAGAITDGTKGPGEAGGERIARLIDEAQAKDLAALVVRVDSPGGSVSGSEAIRQAILRQKARGLPVVVSMANVAASGGYWVSTPGTQIFAQPETITGSIGIFAVIPSFEKALAKYGITGDGVRTTPLSGQPDVTTGLTPQVEAMLQANIEAGYARFVGLVAASRNKTPAQVDAIAQGRVWDGGTAHQLGLVDRFGGLDDALAAAASAAKLKPDGWHAVFLGATDNPMAAFFASLGKKDEDEAPAQDGLWADAALPHDWAGMVATRQRLGLARAMADVDRLMAVSNAQVLCLECAGAAGLRPLPTGQMGAFAARGGAIGMGVPSLLALWRQGL